MEIISLEICEEIVNKHFSGRVSNFELQPITGEKRGALGEYYHLHIITTDGALKLFVKTVLKNPNRPQFTNLVTYKENQFYAQVEKLKELVPNLDVSFMPRCYMQTDRFLIMEDVEGINLSGKLGFDEVNQVMKKLAKLHACSFVWERLYDKSLRNEEFVKESLFATDENFVGSGYVFGVVNGICKLLESERFEDDTVKNFKNLANQALDVFNKKTNFTSVCCHGDLWSNNVMYLPQKECKLIDFQMIRYAPPAHDLNMLIYLNCSSQTIRNHLEDFTDNYYTYLQFELNKYNINIFDVIDKNEYYSSCKYFWNISKFVRMYYKAFKAATKKRALSKIMRPLDVIMRENEGNFIVDMMEIDVEFKSEVLELLDDLRISLKYLDLPPESCFMVINQILKEYELLDYSLEESKSIEIDVIGGNNLSKKYSVYDVYTFGSGRCQKTDSSILFQPSSVNEYILKINTLSDEEKQEHIFLLKRNDSDLK